MTYQQKIESETFRLKDIESLRNLFGSLNFDYEDKPVDKENWSQKLNEIVVESRIVARKDNYFVYYIKTNSDSIKAWKEVATRIISDNHGFCLVCSHNPSGFQWIFSSISKEFSKSFSETRHIPIEIKPNLGVPKPFLEFLQSIKVEDADKAINVLRKISDAFDKFSLQIHDELTINVFEALKILSEGIVYEKANNLELSDSTLEKIREPIFMLLYRIMFVLYAEDRGIFPTEHNEYYKQFSLKWIKHEVLLIPEARKRLEEYEVEKRLRRIFRLIELGSEDFGYKPEEFFMRSYYGRLFDRKIHFELEKWKIPNKQLFEAISLLTGTRDIKGNYFFLDYAALETRHLGSIYEHLLEYHLGVKGKKIADLPDPQQRKNTGSYYTPQYIVDYIVKNTIEPLIDEIVKNVKDINEQIEKILSLNILDPAMGSGHFLIGVVNYIARTICEIEHDVSKERLIERKRDVVRRCIYGVDINPLAVDLAMVSLWLETLSSERPLSFLNAHLKCGNSLIGSKIDTLFDKQTTLMESQRGRYRFEKTIKDFLIFENLEDDSASAVKTKMEKYREAQAKGTLYYDLNFLLNCKTAESFGINIPALGDYKAMIGENSLDFFTTESLQEVKKISSTYQFFHWDLEFPDIFYDEKGNKKQNAGFDVVLGNPPYVKISTLTEREKKFLYREYKSAKGRFDLYIIFIEQALSLVKEGGYFSFITPNKYIKTKNGKELRKTITGDYLIKRFVDFGDLKVFSNKTTYPSIIILQNSKPKEQTLGNFIMIKKIAQDLVEQLNLNQTSQNFENSVMKVFTFTQKELDWKSWNFVPEEINKIYEKISSSSRTKLGDLTEKLYEGFVSGDNEIYFVDSLTINKYNLEPELLRPSPKAKDVRNYYVDWSDRFVLFPYRDQKGKTIAVSINNYPNTKKYLEKYRTRLASRKSLKGTSKKWYEMIRPREFNWFENDKIICPSLSDKNNFCVDFAENSTKKHFFVDHDCYGIILKDKGRENYLLTIGILNSKLVEFFIKQKSPMYSGGYYLYQSQYLEQIPIMNFEPQLRNDLIMLIRKLHDRKLTNENIIEAGQQINDIIYNQYDIKKEEQEIIERFLDSSWIDSSLQI